MRVFAALGIAVLSLSTSCATPAPKSPTIIAAQDEQPSPQQEQVTPSRKSIVRSILQHNVRIVVYDGDTAKRTASGVVIGSEPSSTGAHSYILTNAHVLESKGYKAPRLAIVVDRGPESMEYAAEPLTVGSVPEMDLALLRVRGVTLVPASLAKDEDLELGEDVMVVAAPYGKAISLSGGMISQVEWDRKTKTPTILKTDAPIGYGASGGGIYSRDTGKLVAIVEGYRTAKVGFAVAEQNYSFDVPMPGETFGAPTAKVRAFLTDAGFERFLKGAGTHSGERAEAAVR